MSWTKRLRNTLDLSVVHYFIMCTLYTYIFMMLGHLLTSFRYFSRFTYSSVLLRTASNSEANTRVSPDSKSVFQKRGFQGCRMRKVYEITRDVYLSAEIMHPGGRAFILLPSNMFLFSDHHVSFYKIIKLGNCAKIEIFIP